MFESLMDNYQRVEDLAKAGENSFGALAEANQKRVESLEGQINIFKDKMLAFTDALQPLIFGSVELGNTLLDLVNGFGAIPTVVGLASASFLSFSNSGQQLKTTLLEMAGSKIKLVDGINQIISAQNKAVETSKNEVAITQQQISSTIKRIAQLRLEHTEQNSKIVDIQREQQALVGLNKELVNNQKQLAIATLKATAFQAVLSLGLSAVVSGLVWGLGKLWTSLKDGGINLDSVNSKFQELNNSQIELSKTVTNLDNMVAKYEDLEQQMKNSGKGSEEYKQAEESLLEIQKQIAENYPTLVSYIDEEGNAYATNLDSIKSYTEAQRELLETQKEALESTAKTNKPKLEVELGELETDRDKIKEKIDYYTQQIEDLETKMANSGNAIFKTLAKGDIAMFTSEKNRLIEKLTETNEKISETSKTLVGYEQILQETSDSTKEATTSTNELADSIKELDESSNMKKANESYLKSLESIKEAKDLLDSFDEGLDVSEMRSLFDSELLADYNGALTDTVALQDHLKSKIGEMEAQGLLAYANLKGENESFWTSANANSEDYFNNTIKNTSLWENFTKQVNENLALIHSNMVNSMGNKYEDYFNDVKTAYGVDLSNCKTAAEARIKIEAEAAEKIAQMRKAISQASYDYGTVTMPDGTEINYGEYHETPDTSKFNEAIAQIQAWKNQAIGALSQVGQFQDAVFNSTTTKPSSGSSSSNKGSSSSEKEVADLDLKIDRYYDLQDAIDDVNNALTKNQALQERATGTEKAKLMKEEIKLYQDLQKATQDLVKEQQKERDELKKTISSYGGTFDSNGDIKNRKKWLEGLQAQVNKLSGESKEAKKEEIETLMAIIERYEELHNDTIPSTQLEYENLTNTIKDLQKEQLEYITDLQKDITSAIESELKKRTEAIKTELEKQKDLYNSQYDEENWERELATEQRKLDEIQQQIDNAMRDTSLAGQLYLQQLREEYAEQEKAINEMIREKEHELGENRFDEEIEKIEKEEEAMLDPENIADLVNKAIANGFVSIGNETIQLNQLMSDWLDDTGDGLYAVGNLLKSEMIDNLKTVKSLMQDVGLVSLSGGVAVSSASYVPTANTRAIDNAISNNTNNNSNVSIGSLLTVQGNVTEDVMPQLQSMISQSEKQITNSIMRALTFS